MSSENVRVFSTETVLSLFANIHDLPGENIAEIKELVLFMTQKSRIDHEIALLPLMYFCGRQITQEYPELEHVDTSVTGTWRGWIADLEAEFGNELAITRMTEPSYGDELAAVQAWLKRNS